VRVSNRLHRSNSRDRGGPIVWLLRVIGPRTISIRVIAIPHDCDSRTHSRINTEPHRIRVAFVRSMVLWTSSRYGRTSTRLAFERQVQTPPVLL